MLHKIKIAYCFPGSIPITYKIQARYKLSLYSVNQPLRSWQMCPVEDTGSCLLGAAGEIQHEPRWKIVILLFGHVRARILATPLSSSKIPLVYVSYCERIAFNQYAPTPTTLKSIRSRSCCRVSPAKSKSLLLELTEQPPKHP